MNKLYFAMCKLSALVPLYKGKPMPKAKIFVRLFSKHCQFKDITLATPT